MIVAFVNFLDCGFQGMAQKKLQELPFMDLYVCLDGDAPAHYRQIPLGRNEDLLKEAELDNEVPPEFQDDIAKITAFLREKFIGDEMGLTFEGIRLRAAKVTTAGGLVWAAMRRINDQPPKLEKLGLVPALIPQLQKLGQRDGLILLCGATGQGKTTTCCALLADYLERLGGVAFTIEDPVEYNLEGRRGKNGFCYQIEVNKEEEWAEMLKRALRWHPRYRNPHAGCRQPASACSHDRPFGHDHHACRQHRRRS
jgi:hypothetical protein